MSNDLDNPNKDLNPEFDQVCQTAIGYVEHARKNVLKSVNHEQTIAYWKIGRLIVETEQQGKERAGYGTALLKTLSERLTREFKRGFSLTNIKYMRIFYQTFRDRIRHQAGDEFQQPG